MLCDKRNLFFALLCCVSLTLVGCSVDDPGAGSEDTGVESALDTGEDSDGSADAPSDGGGDVDDAGEAEDATSDATVGEDTSDAADTAPDGKGDDPTYDWKVGSWSQCSVDCGGGEQTRDVSCQSDAGEQVSDAACSDPKPDESQACNTQTCTEDCPQTVNICNASSETDCNVTLNEARQTCFDAGCTPSGPTECVQGGSPSNPNCWGAVVECN